MNFRDIAGFWKWTRNLYNYLQTSEEWYNKKTPFSDSYLPDYTSYVLPYPIMRQIRVIKGEIPVKLDEKIIDLDSTS